MEDTIDKLSLESNDILILKGKWEPEQMQHLASLMQTKGFNNIVICIPETQSLEKMPVKEFYYMLKKVEERVHGESTETTEK